MSKNYELMLLAEQNAAQSYPSDTVKPKSVWVAPISAADSPAATQEIDDYSRVQVSNLVRHLFFVPGGVHAVALTAVEPGNGSSWMTVQCARVLAGQGRGRICVIDANLYTPTLHKYFSVRNDRGLSDALSQTELKDIHDFVSPVPLTPNLSLMTSGSMTSPKRGPLPADAFGTVLSTMRASYDYLLIDTPPIGMYSDALAVGLASDGVAMIIAEQSTRERTARQALKELTKANVRVLGAVLNKRTFPIPQRIYERL